MNTIAQPRDEMAALVVVWLLMGFALFDLPIIMGDHKQRMVRVHERFPTVH